jgi:hypothetical protein
VRASVTSAHWPRTKGKIALDPAVLPQIVEAVEKIASD